MWVESGAPFASLTNAMRLRKAAVFRSAQMLLIAAGLSGCAVPLRGGFGPQDGYGSHNDQIMASAERAGFRTGTPSLTWNL